MRSIVLWSLSILLVCAVAWMANKTVRKIKAKKQATEKVSALHNLPLFTLDSTRYVFQNNAQPLAIIFFNSECEHCQYEMREINQKQSLFLNKKLILLSSENISTIIKASEDFGLAHYLPNIHFAKINDEDVFSTFGSVSVPHIFIYDEDGRLIKEFKGETKVEAIAKYLQ